MKNIFGFIAERSGMIAILSIMSIALPARFLLDLRINNSIEVWVPQKSIQYQEYREFVNRYGSDEFVVVGLDTPDPLSDVALARQRDLAGAFRSIEGVDGVWDLPSLSAALWGNTSDWKLKAARNSFLRNSVLGVDGHTAGMFIWLKPLQGPDSRRHLIERIDAARAPFLASDFKTHIAGAPRMNVALDVASERDSVLFMPAALFICIVALFWMLRDFRSVLGPMVAVCVSATWTVGLMVMSGHTLNVVTVVMPTLHFVLGLSNGIRLVSRYKINLAELGDPKTAIARTLEQLFLPLLFMTVTMVVGFLALLTSELAPIQELGAFSAIGLVIAFLSNILVVPGIMSYGRSTEVQKSSETPSHFSANLGTWSLRRAHAVLLTSMFVILICSLVIPRIETESNVLNFFPPDSEVQLDYEFIGRRLTGYYTVELELQAKESKGYEVIESLKKMESDALLIPGVVRSDHIGKLDILRSSSPRGPPDSNPQEPSPFAGLADRFYYEYDGEIAMRFCVLVNTMRSSEFYPLIKKLQDLAQKRVPKDTTIRITGIVPLLNQAQKALVETQINSFATAFCIITIMIGLLFMSPVAALVSILPNLIPILLTFAWMSLRRIPLDSATVMIASVAIGIAVDNTIYFLARFREERLLGVKTESALQTTFHTIGQPIIFTSLVAASGFAVLALAGFQPIASFGTLTALTMLTALVSTVLITPACVRFLRLWERSETPCVPLATMQ